MILHNDKRVNSPKRYNNLKWVYNYQENFKIPEAKTTLEYSLAVSYKVKSVRIYYPVLPLLGVYSREIKTYVHIKSAHDCS